MTALHTPPRRIPTQADVTGPRSEEVADRNEAAATRKRGRPGDRTAANSTSNTTTLRNYRHGDTPIVVAATLVSLVAALGLGRLFTSRGPLPAIAAVVLLTHATGATARRLRVPVAVSFVVGAGAAAMLIANTQFASTVRHGIPTRLTWRLAAATVSASWRQFHSVRAPVPTQLGFTVSAMAGAWLVSALGDVLLFRARLLAEGILPSAALVIFTAALATRRYRFPAIALYIAAAALLVVLTRRSERRNHSPWLGREIDGRATTLAAALVLVAAVVGAAMFVAPRVPNATAKGIVNWRAQDRKEATRTALSPLVSLKSRLESQSGAEMFSVSATTAAYWRLTALENFDGAQWTSEGAVTGAGRQLSNRYPNRAGTNTALQQEFRIAALSSIWLPAAYQPVGVFGVGTETIRGIRFDAKAGSLTTARASASGLAYRVRSALPELTADVLAQLVPGDPGAEYRRLPAAFSARVSALAEQITGRYQTAYGKARALQDFFRRSFVYDLRPPPPISGDQLVEFVFRTRRGYCEHFASAYAAMARSIGLPARVAVGFTPGQLGPDGRFHVTGRQAHAWPEVFLSGAGWVPFEPTPGRGIPGAEPYTGVPAQQDIDPNDPNVSTTTVATVPSTVAGSVPQSARATTRPVGLGPRVWSSSRWSKPLRVLLVLLALVLGGIGARELRRRFLRRRSPTQLESAWREAEDALTWVGAHRRLDESAMAFAQRASHEVADGDDALLLLASQVDEGRYAADPPDLPRTEAQRLVREVEAGVTITLSQPRRIVRSVDPRLRRGRRQPGGRARH